MTHKLPAFQFYPADWRKDPGVQALSFFDRGVWFEMLCLMHESEQRGRLLLNGNPMPDDALARLLGLDKQNLTKTLTCLLDYGVATRDEQGALVNRRMLRDEALRQIRTEIGKLGGNPLLVKQKPTKAKKEVKQKTTPSSSSSSSPSGLKEKYNKKKNLNGNGKRQEERRPPAEVTKREADAWASICDHLRKRLNKDVFKTWFDPVYFDGIETDVEVVRVRLRAGQVTRDWIEMYYAELLDGALRAVLSDGNVVVVWEIE